MENLVLNIFCSIIFFEKIINYKNKKKKLILWIFKPPSHFSIFLRGETFSMLFFVSYSIKLVNNFAANIFFVGVVVENVHWKRINNTFMDSNVLPPFLIVWQMFDLVCYCCVHTRQTLWILWVLLFSLKIDAVYKIYTFMLFIKFIHLYWLYTLAEKTQDNARARMWMGTLASPWMLLCRLAVASCHTAKSRVHNKNVDLAEHTRWECTAGMCT